MIEEAAHLPIAVRRPMAVIHAAALLVARHAPTQDESGLPDGNVAAVGPTSAITCCAESTPRPGTSARRSTAGGRAPRSRAISRGGRVQGDPAGTHGGAHAGDGLQCGPDAVDGAPRGRQGNPGAPRCGVQVPSQGLRADASGRGARWHWPCLLRHARLPGRRGEDHGDVPPDVRSHRQAARAQGAGGGRGHRAARHDPRLAPAAGREDVRRLDESRRAESTSRVSHPSRTSPG